MHTRDCLPRGPAPTGERTTMKRIAFVLALLMLLTAPSGCRIGATVRGSGVQKTEKRDLPPFKVIESEGALDIQATCQKPASFEIEGDDNIVPLVQSEVRDGVLYLNTEKGYSPSKDLLVRITVPNLESVRTTGAGELRIQDLKNEKFVVRSTGAATVTASGESRSVEIEGTGAGTIDAHRLHAERANVSSTGAATIDVYASEQLDVKLTGAGTVNYSGDPKIVNKNVSIGATLSKREQSMN